MLEEHVRLSGEGLTWIMKIFSKYTRKSTKDWLRIKIKESLQILVIATFLGASLIFASYLICCSEWEKASDNFVTILRYFYFWYKITVVLPDTCLSKPFISYQSCMIGNQNFPPFLISENANSMWSFPTSFVCECMNLHHL